MSPELAVGIDVGGTKLAVGLVDASGTVIASDRTATPARESATDVWMALAKLVTKVMDAVGNPEVAGIGVGCAGPIAWPEGVVSPLNIPAWRGYPLRRRLREMWPDVPVRLHNDAVAMAAAEHWQGAAVGSANALGMVVSTGVGGGLIVDNRLVDGGLGNAGHIGHMVVDPKGPICVCGGRGCLEAIARGPAVAAWALEQGWTPLDSGEAATAKTLAADAAAGDEIGIAAYKRCGEAIGIALASTAALLDLDIAVIGGGLVQSGDLLLGPLESSFKSYAGLPHAARMKIAAARLGQNAGIIGAAAFIHQGRRYWNAKPGAGD